MKRSKSEKRFIKVLLLPALLALAAAGLCSCAQRNTDYSEDLFAMDTVMSIRAIGPDAEEAVKAAVSEIRRLDSLLSTGNDSSDISAINRNKTAQTDQDTALLAFRAKEIYRLTGGAFDPTVYPVMRLWGFTDRNYQVPEEEALQAAAATVNGESLQIDGNTVSVAADQEMDLGGIAKGFTSARVIEILKQHGITSALVNLGGNVQTLGSRPDGKPWTIGIRDPKGDSAEELIGAVTAVDRAVITSGGYERFFEEDGKTYIHIVDPKTGYPAENDLASVTVVSPDGTLADGLSTALYVMGREKASAFWKDHSDLFDCVLIDTGGRLYVSEGIAEDFTSFTEEPVLLTK